MILTAAGLVHAAARNYVTTFEDLIDAKEDVYATQPSETTEESTGATLVLQIFG